MKLSNDKLEYSWKENENLMHQNVWNIESNIEKEVKTVSVYIK